jgi:hypothetical protein
MKSPLLKVDVLKRKWRNSIMATGTLWIASDMQIISWRADISLSIHGKTKKFLAMVQTAPVANHPSAYDLVLSTLCFQDESVRYLVGKQFTAQSIKGATQQGHAVISGTTLLAQAQLVMQNWKKAWLTLQSSYFQMEAYATGWTLQITSIMFSRKCIITLMSLQPQPPFLMTMVMKMTMINLQQ